MARAFGAVFLVVVGVMGSACASTEPSRDAAGTGALVVLDARSGKTIWEARPTKRRLMQVAGTGAGLLVAVDGECTEDTSSAGRAIAFDTASGARRWEAPPISAATRTMVWAASPSVDVAARGVIVSPGGRGGPQTVGRSAGTGRRVWSIEGESFLGVSGQLVFTAAPAGAPARLVAHDRRTGRRRWSFPPAAPPGWTAMFDVVAADRTHVVVGNGDYTSRIGDRPGSSTTLFVLDARTGRQTNAFVAADPTFSFSEMALADAALVYAEGSAVVSRDLRTGAVRWSRAFDDAAGPGGGVPGVLLRAPRSRTRVLANVTGPGFRRVVALDTRTGAIAWQRPASAVGATGRGMTVLTEDSSPLVAVDTSTGTRRWQRTVPRIVGGRYARIAIDINGGRVAVSQVCDLG